MTFGFPARHTETRRSPVARDDLRDAVVDALDALSWAVRNETRRGIKASTGMGLRSWGERIEIAFLDNGSLEVSSRCVLVTQCFDWGKNRKNVHRFFDELQRMAREIAAVRDASPDEVRGGSGPAT